MAYDEALANRIPEALAGERRGLLHNDAPTEGICSNHGSPVRRTVNQAVGRCSSTTGQVHSCPCPG